MPIAPGNKELLRTKSKFLVTRSGSRYSFQIQVFPCTKTVPELGGHGFQIQEYWIDRGLTYMENTRIAPKILPILLNHIDFNFVLVPKFDDFLGF